MAYRKKETGKWAARGPRDANGDREWLGYFDTEAEAEGAEDMARLGVTRKVKTVQELVTIWLRDYPRKAPSTNRTYRYATDRIAADIGSENPHSIDRPRARRQSNAWPREITRVCRTMWADMVRDGVLTLNPWTNLRLETPKGRKDLTAPTEQEVLDLATAAEESLGKYGIEFGSLIAWQGFVGTRPGEMCALHRADVDLISLDANIRRSLDGHGGEKLPKNDRERVIAVAPLVVPYVQRVPVRVGSPYLFHSKTGKRLSKGSISYYFRLVVAHWGVRPLEMYELRHACATMLMERGLPPHVVANQLGHLDGGALVQRLYGHPREAGMRDQVRAAMSHPGAIREQNPRKSGSVRRVS